MTDQDLLEAANNLLTEARNHRGISICVNPVHNHRATPCEEHCLDHIHRCSKGCGNWPCKSLNLGDELVNHLLSLDILLGIRKEIMEEIETLVQEFQQESPENQR